VIVKRVITHQMLNSNFVQLTEFLCGGTICATPAVREPCDRFLWIMNMRSLAPPQACRG